MTSALVHDGRVITESTVICEYVDDQWPDQPLKPGDSFGRAQMRFWTKQLDASEPPHLDSA
jgi:glutathione S-transferase